MAEQLPSSSPGAGKESSEFQLTKMVVIVGTVVTALGGVLEVLAQVGVGEKWVGIALMGIGVAAKVLRVAGYEKGRNDLKSQAIEKAAEERKAIIHQVASMEQAEEIINKTISGKVQ
jgi:hypothetical protein